MGIMVDKINKIIYVLPHKAGQFTISTFLMNIYGRHNDPNYNAESNYYSEKLEKMGYTEWKDEYSEYYKVLILRDPYKRFISGFLQDCCEGFNIHYKNIHITFLEYCKHLQNIHTNYGVNYYIKNNEKIYIEHYFTEKKQGNNQTKTKLIGHQRTIWAELWWFIMKYNFSFDKVIMVDDLDQSISDIKKQFNINVDLVTGNKKKYTNNDIDIINTTLADIANGASYPTYEKFYNTEIQEIVKKIYQEDFKLIKRFGLEDKVKPPISL